MRVNYGLIDKNSGMFARNPDTQTHLFNERDQAESWREFLTEIEPGDWSIVRMKIV